MFSSNFHQHVVLCITGRFYTILTEPHIINKITSGLRVRKNNQQAFYQSPWCFISNYTHGLLLVPWVWILHYLDPTPCYEWNNKITTMELHRNQWRLFKITPTRRFLYHGWILYNLIQSHLIIKTTNGFRVTKITTR